MGVYKKRGSLFGGSYNKDYTIFGGYTKGTPYLGGIPFSRPGPRRVNYQLCLASQDRGVTAAKRGLVQG